MRLTACVAAGLLVAGCVAQKFEEREQAVEHQKVNCATAEGDLRVLASEKAHVAEQVGAGISAVMPAGMLVGQVTGTEATKMRVATGEYNAMIDAKIAEIERTCGL